MALSPGTRVGPYEITALIGEGGMGQVWRARHVALGRDDALKVLPATFQTDPERLARFHREAQVLASLNHVNIARVYGLEQFDGSPAIVMELVEGPTLADRIVEGAMALDEALPIGRQIATALEAAHEHGVIHRDLKPSNIKLGPDGTVKVLDFGLAKILDSEAQSSSTLSMSPTVTSPAMSRFGVVLGTAPYVSPEQARGKAVDKRTDIWAFGVVLYEMVTGKPLFQGEDLTDTLSSIVKVNPDLSDAPPQLRRLLKKCLEKDPRKRLRDIGDAWELLDVEAEERAPVPGGHRRALLPWLLVGGLLLAFGSLAIVHFRETAPAAQAMQFLLDAPSETTFVNQYGGFAPSPDGRYVAMTIQRSGTTSLWLRPLDSTTARPLAGTDGANFPTWSPDSGSLAFVAQGKLKRIDIAGGAPLTLADVQPAVGADTAPVATWNREGVMLFGSAAGLQRTSAASGGASLLTKVDAKAKEDVHTYPQFLPDGNRFIYFVVSPDPNVQGVYASSLDNPKTRRQILRTGAKAVYVPPRETYPGYLLWMQEQALFAQRFDADTLTRQDDPIPLAEEIGSNPNFPSRAGFWASDAGLLVYFGPPPDAKRQLVWMSRDGKDLGAAAPADVFTAPALSPDGQRLAVQRRVIEATGPNIDVYLWEFARQTMRRLTSERSREGIPVWSPVDPQLVFASDRDGGPQIYRRNLSGAAQDERLTSAPNPKLPLDWSLDGKYLLYRERDLERGNWDVKALPLQGGGQNIPVATTPFNEATGRFSPDGKWVAYHSDETGRSEVYVKAFEAEGPAGRLGSSTPISNTGGGDMKWRDDGRELYYETPAGQIMAVGIHAGPDGIRVDTPRELFRANIQTGGLHSFDATGDGQRFLLLLNPPEGQEQRLTIVSNFQATLR